jgi:hypothetical protein
MSIPPMEFSSPDEPRKDSPAEEKAEVSEPPQPIPSWPDFVKTAPRDKIIERFRNEVDQLVKATDKLGGYLILGLLDPESSISSFDADSIYKALGNAIDKDVLLIILSTGGAIEPAYQISKLCKLLCKNKFVVAIPREAKSAATLIALGADEIHMGPLSQLGPIDPQIGGLPALGVIQALKTLAEIAENYPKSADMFARYLRFTLTVEQIGYCERISESATQYAERLLSTKPSLKEKAKVIARVLVHEYKHHRFVIDMEEALERLGSEWIKTGTPELSLAEGIYNLFDWVNFWLGDQRRKRLLVVGNLNDGIMLLDKKEK